ncbi:MAG: DUF3429 family protein [Gammaproteobacteria bacterium]|nr:DUF3429 family protein [Gammaproteobacteria bacterium]
MAEENIFSRIKTASRDSRVVVVGSALTDSRELLQRLQQAGIEHHELRLPMGDEDNRESFRALAGQTGSRRLPQCFLDGHFVGGPLELYAKLGLTTPVSSGSADHLVGLARALGYAGLIPFVLGGALVLLLGPQVFFGLDTLRFLLSYAAVILSFVGAVHWGVALAGPVKPFKARLMTGLSVVPALVGWVALLMWQDPALATLILLLGFALWWLYEWAVPGKHVLARWYVRLRLQLSGVVCGVLLLVWLRLVLMGQGLN